jgi:FdrA protein
LSAAPSVLRAAVRVGAYFDSVVLLRLQRALAARPGVLGAGAVMATPANKEILGESDLLAAEVAAARADDLLIVVRAVDALTAEQALGAVDELLRGPREAASEGYRPRSLRAAFQELPEARWVMVSVPGLHAARLAWQALAAGRNVFLYSDNVSLEEEKALKREAAARGLFVLGPDCGTAILGGVGFGFANRVRAGSIGLVGASGTGLQAVASAIDAHGGGVSHAIGTGGRDLHAVIGGATALQAIDALARDEATRVVVLLSKPPAPRVATKVLAALRACGKPAVVHFLGHPRPARRLGNLHFATSLAEAAEIAAALERGAEASPPPAAGASQPLEAARPGWLRGLFSGGTLAYEALFALETLLGPIESNLHDAHDPGANEPGHRLLDLGDDAYTVGRPHPMIDLAGLRERVLAAAAEEDVAVVFLDSVLGHGAHADPASELAPDLARAHALAAERGRTLTTVIVLVGTELDPQDVTRQQAVLAAAGARVVRSVEDGVAAVVEEVAPVARAARGAAVPVDLAALRPPFGVINAGLESFRDSLAAQGAQVVQMDWRPPAGGDPALLALLDRMSGGSVPQGAG